MNDPGSFIGYQAFRKSMQQRKRENRPGGKAGCGPLILILLGLVVLGTVVAVFR